MIFIEDLERLVYRNKRAQEFFQQQASQPAATLERRFTLQEVCEAVGVSVSTIFKHRDMFIETGELDDFDEQEKRRGRKGYTLKQLNQLRAKYGKMPTRGPGDPCFTVSVQHFKGGVGKTTTAVGLAQYLAIMGYRVCLLDLDFQGSATSSFGLIPDNDISEGDTLIPFYLGEEQDLRYCVRETLWPGLDLIPSNMLMHNVEFSMVSALSRSSSGRLNEAATDVIGFLKRGIATVEDDYDIVIIDSPPHAGLVAMSILYAADALVIPSPPSMYDFSSLKQFFQISKEQFESVKEEKSYHFVKVLATKVQTAKKLEKDDEGVRKSQEDMLHVMKQTLGPSMYKNYFWHSQAVEDAQLELKSVYTARRPQKRAKQIMDAVFSEIEADIVSHWPSREGSLGE